MSSRVTRSSARLAADPPTESVGPPPPSRKRKASGRREPSPAVSEELVETAPSRRAKRQRVAKPEPAPPPRSSPPPSRRRGKNAEATMSNPGSSSKANEELNKASGSSSSSKRRPSKGNRPIPDSQPPTQSPPARRPKKRPNKRDMEVAEKDAPDPPPEASKPEPPNRPADHSDSHDESSPRDMDDDDLDDPFRSGFLGGRVGPGMSLQSTLRALSGVMSGTSSRLREILNNLRLKDDPTMQRIALEELSNLLLVSNEDTLSGQFSPDPYVKELVALMQPSETGEDNPDVMLLACRCLANLMEALRGSVANVVYGGAVPVLCQKLLDIEYIDLAEQALSTLSKISVDFPASIVREGGLTACLQFLDFFPTGTQRTAVTTAANCCRNIPQDSFPVIRDVMPILLNVLSSHDQKVVEQGCLCVTGVIDSFKHKRERLEELVKPELLQAILRLLLPGTTNLIGDYIHTQFLRVLGIVARISPSLSVELLKMNVVDTLYQILTGVSPPSDTDDAATKIDSVVVMQALIHRPREQVFETLNVICGLLPSVPGHDQLYEDFDGFIDEEANGARQSKSKSRIVDKRVELLNGCKQETKRFAMILLPTLTDAYSSTVNLGVRQKVLIAQLKMLCNLDTHVIEDALRPVQYASFLASILSQQDHPTLVKFALQATELLLERLEHIYQYQFYREGVVAEIKKLSETPLDEDPEALSKDLKAPDLNASKPRSPTTSASPDEDGDDDDDDEADEKVGDEDSSDDDDEENGHDENDDDEDEDEGEREDGREDLSGSDSSSSASEHDLTSAAHLHGVKDLITLRAKIFIEKYTVGRGQEMREKAAEILEDLQNLSRELEECYLGDGSGDGEELFARLASYFDGDALQSVTSFELLNSEIIRVLVDISSKSHEDLNGDAKTTFLQAFMGRTITTKIKTGNTKSSTTAFSVLVHKLQDLLSRAEHFEVLTVNHGSSESSRSNATSMLSKQLRLKLVADEDSAIPRPYKDVMVSIHAIATFKALDDYLRPRISLSERPRGARHREAMLSHLASSRLREQYDRTSENSLFGSGESGQPPLPETPASGNRNIPRSTPKTKPAAGQPSEPPSTSTGDKPAVRRSNRRQQLSATSAPPPPPAPLSEPASQTLECADERQLTDEDEIDEEEALDAIVDDFDDDLSDNDEADPTAVNMEVASTGKVTARKEDGTRVATPQQSSTPTTKPHVSAQGPAVQAFSGNSLALAGRPFSYAAALAAIPQDWHIEFSIDDKKIPNETTIYRAVYHNREQPEDPVFRNIWSGVHMIKFKRVKGPPPPESVGLTIPSEVSVADSSSGMPPSLDKHPTTSAILRLLKILHGLNSNLDDVLSDNKMVRLTPEPLAQFINTKLTAKMNRQLEEPLIVASNCLPSWSEDLSRHFSFLFPFETRHLYLQSTSFGYSRSMMRWQNTQSNEDERSSRRRDERPFLGRLQRQKVRISRTRILESAVKVMELYGGSPSVLEVEYFEEVGTGLGPTLEFYSTVSKEFSKKKLQMWRENDSNDHDEYAFGKLGLFPAPLSDKQARTEGGKKLLHLFKMLGKFVARSMLDSRIIDISFNPTFFRIGESLSASHPSLAAVRSVDRDLANSLWEVKQYANAAKEIEESRHLSAVDKVNALQNITIRGARIDDLGIDFTLPGYPNIELIPDGSNKFVTIDNVGEYVDRVVDLTLGSGVGRQLEAFRSGFSQVFPYEALSAFTANELVMLFGRVEEDWSIETLMDSIKADHGFNMDSRSVRNLLQTMSELSPTQRRDFLQFVTGSPKLPIGGFKALTPMFTVVCKPSEPPYAPDDYLPSVMTCVNYLKLPDYTNLEMLRQRLNVAIQEGQGAFHLS